MVLRKHRLPIALRHFAPAGFFASLLLLFLVSYLSTGWQAFVGYILPVSYVTVLSLGGMSVARTEGMFVGLMFPVVAFIMHISYALGFLGGIMGESRSRKKEIGHSGRSGCGTG